MNQAHPTLTAFAVHRMRFIQTVVALGTHTSNDFSLSREVFSLTFYSDTKTTSTLLLLSPEIIQPIIYQLSSNYYPTLPKTTFVYCSRFFFNADEYFIMTSH